MPRMYLACLVALGVASSSCAESGRIGVAEFATALEGGSCASGEEFVLLQHQARQQEANQLYERDDVAVARPSSSSSKKDGKLTRAEVLYAGGHGGQSEGHCKQVGPDDGFHQCGCYNSKALVVRPNDNPAVYQGWTMWKPSPGTVFNEVQQQHAVKHLFRDAAVMGLMPGIAYNPSVLPLPESLAASWHPDARYVAVSRHFRGWGECKWKTQGEGSDVPWTGSDYSSVVLLNQDLETLVVGQLPLPIEDYRLFAYEDKVLVTANYVNKTTKNLRRLWSYRVFELDLNFIGDHSVSEQCPEHLQVMLNEFQYNGLSDFDHESSLFRFYGKNIGLMDNKKDGELQLLWRLSNPVAVRQWNSEILYTELSSSALRNNGNPVYLPEYDAYLAIGHTFWEGDVRREGHKDKHFVRNYVHRIVLFDAKAPYNWLRASTPFCLPSVSGMSKTLYPLLREEWCESIQFIMSWFREGDDILITYGITDCEPAIARVPLEVLLEAASANFTRHPEGPSDSQAKLMKGAWQFDADEYRVMT